MPRFKLDDARCPTYPRSDGVLHRLVPEPQCELCYKPIHPNFADTARCYDCELGKTIDETVLERVIAATIYIPRVGGPHNSEIWKLKKSGSYAKEYAEVLDYVLKTEGIPLTRKQLLVPIPQTRTRSMPAGPFALASELSEITGVEMLAALQFAREVERQKDLTLEGRRANVEDSMTSRVSLRGREVILVDDVLTSGYTMLEGARVVRRKGAVSVMGVVAARDVSLEHLRHAGVLKNEA